jgi:hypothetical protein
MLQSGQLVLMLTFRGILLQSDELLIIREAISLQWLLPLQLNSKRSTLDLQATLQIYLSMPVLD